MKALQFIFVVLLFAACFEDDMRVLPWPGDIITIPDSVQEYQTWFDLESGSVISVNHSADWELAFESSAAGWRIQINSGADWFIYNTNSGLFPASGGMPGKLEGMFDNQMLWPDSTAVGNWPNRDDTYILGRYVNGAFTELKSIRFLMYTDTSYRFVYSGEMIQDTVSIKKDFSRCFSYYSFKTKSQVYPEPDRERYDLLFTSYYDKPTLFGQTIPYKVGGVLLNALETSAVLDTVSDYNEISIESIPGLNFMDRRDIPGYNWKNVSVDITGGGSASYSVKTNYNYVIRTGQGNYFRLRFVSYMLDGRSGYPRFEFSRLQ